ncbi:MAG: hypothetical protein R2860_14795 [Desulfobacterales bacterium]
MPLPRESGPTLTEISGKSGYHPVIRLRNLWHEIGSGNKNIGLLIMRFTIITRGNEIFWQYLDPSMTYTCAYWKNGTGTWRRPGRTNWTMSAEN